MTDARYEARDLLKVPSLLSLARVPLAAAFPFALRDVRAALAVLGLAGASDVLDGWWARRFHQTTPLGAVVDGVTDKVFVLTVAVTLLATRRLAPREVALLGVREVGEVALAAWVFAHHDDHALHEEQRACAWGKATTTAQFAAVVLALTGSRARPWACALAAVLGAAAVASYARRATAPALSPEG